MFQAIQRGEIKCNLQGAGIGNGWVSGLDSIISVAPMLFHMVNKQMNTHTHTIDKGSVCL